MLDTTTEVEQIASVADQSGSAVPASSDDFRHVHGTIDSANGGHSETIECPNRASTLTLHVDGWTAAGSVTVYYLDPDGERLTKRDETDNAAFGTDGTADIFLDVAVASPLIEIEITGSETVSLNAYIR